MKKSKLKETFKNALLSRFNERIGAEDYEEIKAYVIIKSAEFADRGRITEEQMIEIIEHIEKTDERLKEEAKEIEDAKS